VSHTHNVIQTKYIKRPLIGHGSSCKVLFIIYYLLYGLYTR